MDRTHVFVPHSTEKFKKYVDKCIYLQLQGKTEPLGGLSCKQEDAFCSLFGFKLEPNKIISSLLLDY